MILLKEEHLHGVYLSGTCYGVLRTIPSAPGVDAAPWTLVTTPGRFSEVRQSRTRVSDTL